MTVRLHRWVLGGSIAVFGLGLVVASEAAAMAPAQVLTDAEARAHFERAQEHFAAEDYEAAIPELKAAYALEPNPMLLYAWGQAERMSGDCRRAVELYRRYLDTDPPEEQRQFTEANLVDCEAELPDSDDDDPDDDPDDDSDDLPPGDRAWPRDPMGGVLLGVGAIGVATGGVLMGIARRRGKQAPNADVEDDYLATIATAQRMNAIGIVSLSVGSALVVGAVIRYATVARKAQGQKDASDTARRWTPTWTGHGVGLVLEF